MATYSVSRCLCGVEFRPLSSRQKHCSPECRFRGLLSRFTDPAVCWEWPLSINKVTGYGQFTVKPAPNQRVETAHRFSFVLHKGGIPAGMYICHACDNRKCCNPAHLFLGTAQDNTDDMRRKGRGYKERNLPRGDAHWMRRDPGRVQEIADRHGMTRYFGSSSGSSEKTALLAKR